MKRVITLKGVKLALTESFLPFLIFLIALFFILLQVDQYIERSRNTLIIPMNDRDTEEDFISQKIRLTGTPNNKLEKINRYIETNQLTKAINGIKRLKPDLRRADEVQLTLAFCYYKINQLKKSLSILKAFPNKDSSRLHFNLGLVYGKDPKTYDLAIQSFKEYLRKNQNSYEGHFNLALNYIKKKDYHEAGQTLLKAIQLSSGKRKARAYYQLGLSYKKNERIEEAENAFYKSIRLDPKLLKARAQWANIIIQEDPSRGLKEFKKVIRLDSKYIHVYYLLGVYFFQQDKVSRALYYLNQGLQQDSNSLKIRSYMGFIYLKTKELNNAKKVYGQLVLEYPQNELYRFNLGRVYHNLEDYPKAINEYNSILALNKKHYKAIVNLGVTYAKMEQYKKAINYYTQALNMKSDSVKTYYNLGILYKKTKRFKLALSFFQKAIDLKPSYPRAFYNMASIYQSLKQEDKAVNYYKKAIRLDDKYFFAYRDLSKIYEAKSDFRRLVDLLNRGISQTGHRNLQNRLAQYYDQRGEYQKAIKIYQDVLSPPKTSLMALIGIARVHLKLKNYKKSEEYIAKYIYSKPKDVEARYIYMVSLFHLDKKKECLKQIKIIEKLSPSYRDTNTYKSTLTY